MRGLHSLAEILLLSADYLSKKGIDRPKREAEDLLSFALKKKRLDLYMNFDRPLEEKELSHYRRLLQRRGEGEPFFYIQGHCQFLDCHLSLDSSVLVPRPETEVWLHALIERLSSQEMKGKKLWDLGTGSGCIALAIKQKLPQLEVHASDLSSAALAKAKENAEKNELDIFFHHGDLCEAMEGVFDDKDSIDIFISNPPYLSLSEWKEAPIELSFEPREALVGGESGLDIYQKLALQLPPFLKRGAELYLEIGEKQGSSLMKIFSQDPWVDLSLAQDWAQKDRLFSCKKN